MRHLLLSALLLFSADPGDVRQNFLNLINNEREKLGLQPLALDPGLNEAAQAHVDDMGARNYAGFSSPEGRTTEDWVRDAGY
ncbi:MAG TPA: CAP domain-containing protein, partial [Thermoanaerobaculia bacterium]|nr:CAP domain-containing protein [Thermoanaerobaculia bacterium]